MIYSDLGENPGPFFTPSPLLDDEVKVGTLFAE